MRFGAAGRTQMLHAAVRACAAAGHGPAFVATAPAAPEYTRDEHDFEALAGELGVPFALGELPDEPADVVISMNWPRMLGAGERAPFAHGVFNAHPGALPRFRGNACPNWAILLGEPAVGLTVHRMSDELDAGPMALQRHLELGERTTIGDVYAWLEEAVPAMFVELLDRLDRGDLPLRDQPDDPALALRCHPRRPEDGRLDWTRPATELDRLVRASSEPFAGAFAELESHPIVVWRARPEPLPMPALGIPGQVVERRPAGEAAVLCGDGLLVLEEVEHRGTRGPATAAIRSTRQRLG